MIWIERSPGDKSPPLHDGDRFTPDCYDRSHTSIRGKKQSKYF
ncbi:hypothetical protein [Oscillatoria acuminata]|nr:hypothetical protein [Oscillatoria acuminata]